MAGFPPIRTNNPQLDNWLRLVEEHITNLASQHGKLEPKDNQRFLGSNIYKDGTPEKRTLYPDLVPLGWAETLSTGTLVAGVNLRVTYNGTGQYTYNFIVPPKDITKYATLGTLYSLDGTLRITKTTDPGFIVLIRTTAGVAADDRHSVLVMAPRDL